MAPRVKVEQKDYTCKAGDSIIHRGRLWVVAQVVCEGTEPKVTAKRGLSKPGRRDLISAFRVIDNGQVLRRTPIYIHDEWRHFKKEPEKQTRIQEGQR